MIIREVLKAATDDLSIGARVRAERDRIWRIIVSQEPLAARVNHMQPRQGRRVAWDDWLFDCYGPGWKEAISIGMRTKRGGHELIDIACAHFELPVKHKLSLDSALTEKKDKPISFETDSPISYLPLPLYHKQDAKIISGVRQLEFVVDNENLAKVLGGEVLTGDEDTYYSALYDMIEEFVEEGWRPRMFSLPLVTWRRRSWNTLADALANLAMDAQTDLEYSVRQLDSIVVKSGQLLQCHSDGGMRTNEIAAAACTITLLVPMSVGGIPERTLLYASAKFINSQVTAAAAEAIALSMAMREVRRHKWMKRVRFLDEI